MLQCLGHPDPLNSRTPPAKLDAGRCARLSRTAARSRSWEWNSHGNNIIVHQPCPFSGTPTRVLGRLHAPLAAGLKIHLSRRFLQAWLTIDRFDETARLRQTRYLLVPSMRDLQHDLYSPLTVGRALRRFTSELALGFTTLATLGLSYEGPSACTSVSYHPPHDCGCASF